MNRPFFFSGRLTFFIVLGFLLASCNKLKELTIQPITIQSPDIAFTIPPLPAGTQTLAEVDIYMNTDSLIKEQYAKLGMDKIKTVKVIRCELYVFDPGPNGTFGFLSDCKVELSSSTNTNLVTIAGLDTNPENRTNNVLRLDINEEADLGRHFHTPVLHYRISGTTRRAIPTALQCVASVLLDVGVDAMP